MTPVAESVPAGTFSISVNLHGNAVELRQVSEDRLVGRYAYGNYMPVGAVRLLELFARRGIRATFFVPGREAERNPGLLRDIVSAGHEVAANGYALEDHGALGDEELPTLKKAHDVLSNALGRAPTGWRAPDGLLSKDTLRHLSSLGYAYDASFQDDDFPYALDADGGAGMIEVPQNQYLLDATLYGVRMTHDRVLKNWVEEFDAHHLAGCYLCMTLHPRPDYGVGRPSRMDMLDDFLGHVARAPGGVRFQTCGEVAATARARLAAGRT